MFNDVNNTLAEVSEILHRAWPEHMSGDPVQLARAAVEAITSAEAMRAETLAEGREQAGAARLEIAALRERLDTTNYHMQQHIAESNGIRKRLGELLDAPATEDYDQIAARICDLLEIRDRYTAVCRNLTPGNLIEGTSLGCLRANSEHIPAIVDALRRPPSGEASPAPLISAWLRETAIQHDPEAWESALPVEDWIDDHTIRLLPGGGGRDLQISRVALAEIFEAIAARAPALGWWGELEGTIRDASVVGGAGYLEEVALAAVREGTATRREADFWRSLALRLSRRERERSSEVVEARRRAHEAAAEAEAARRELAEARAAAEVTRAHDTTAALAALGRALGELAVERAARESLVRERADAARELEVLREQLEEVGRQEEELAEAEAEIDRLRWAFGGGEP